MQVSRSRPDSWLLELPTAALHQVLQQLDQCSLACAAVTCSKLRHAIPAAISKVAVRCRDCPDTCTVGSFEFWLEQDSSCLNNLTHCSIEGIDDACFDRLPCPQLRQLTFHHKDGQLDASDGSPGVLHDCTGLTALDLETVEVQWAPSAAAATAALPELISLRLVVIIDDQLYGKSLFGELQLPSMLTQLVVNCSRPTFVDEQPEAAALLSQLSGLVNLEHLQLLELSGEGVPGGVPSQLVKLTCLDIRCKDNMGDDASAAQLQHLSSLTALHQLTVAAPFESDNMVADSFWSDLQHLSQLTGLGLTVSGMEFSISGTKPWAHWSALQSLSLCFSFVQPKALARLTQLQVLSLDHAVTPEGEALTDLMNAVSQLSLLTELCFRRNLSADPEQPPAAATAFTALSASTNLCVLQLGLFSNEAPPDWVLFRPGVVNPHLRKIDLSSQLNPHAQPLHEQQLQQLCGCCPALHICAAPRLHTSSPAAFAEAVSAYTPQGGVVDAAAVAASAAAQITGLKQLKLWDLSQPTDPALLQLTALKGLSKLALGGTYPKWQDESGPFIVESRARWFNPPDVWIQLLRYLLHDEACRKALLQHSSAAGAAPAELMLAQLAATLAEELEASRHAVTPGSPVCQD